MTPKISIVIPSFNQGKFIRQTIDSILNQRYPAIEVFVMDGGSTDETVAILKSYGDQIHWVSEKDNGQTHAINKGFRLCTGEICGFVNSDDYLMPNSLALIAEAFQDNAIQWITGNYRIVNEQDQPIQSLVAVYKRILRTFSSHWLMLVTNYINQPSTFWRRSLMQQVGEFNEDLRYVMDYEYWLRAYQITRPHKVRDVLSSFRIHQESKGGSQFEAQFDEELAVVQHFTNNKLLLFLHQLHNALIVQVYKRIK